MSGFLINPGSPFATPTTDPLAALFGQADPAEPVDSADPVDPEQTPEFAQFAEDHLGAVPDHSPGPVVQIAPPAAPEPPKPTAAIQVDSRAYLIPDGVEGNVYAVPGQGKFAGFIAGTDGRSFTLCRATVVGTESNPGPFTIAAGVFSEIVSWGQCFANGESLTLSCRGQDNVWGDAEGKGIAVQLPPMEPIDPCPFIPGAAALRYFWGELDPDELQRVLLAVNRAGKIGKVVIGFPPDPGHPVIVIGDQGIGTVPTEANPSTDLVSFPGEENPEVVSYGVLAAGRFMGELRRYTDAVAKITGKPMGDIAFAGEPAPLLEESNGAGLPPVDGLGRATRKTIKRARRLNAKAAAKLEAITPPRNPRLPFRAETPKLPRKRKKNT